jgi:hypothetical protein
MVRKDCERRRGGVVVNHGRTDVSDVRSVCVLCSCRDDDVEVKRPCGEGG